MNEVKKYIAADFASYHAGTMPVQEMHALEKAALDDPFLADALEGYAFTNSAEKDIASIKQRLDEKNKKKKVFFLSPSANTGWWRIAAAVLIITTGSIVFYNLNNKPPQKTIAQNETKPSVKEITSPPSDNIVKEESEKIGTDKNTDAMQSNRLAKNEGAIKKEKIQIITTHAPTASVPVADIMQDKAEKDYNTSAEKSARTKEYTLKGKVTNASGEPVIAAVVENKKNKSAVLTDSTGSFALRSDDSSINATVSALGYDSKSIPLSKDKTKPVELNKNNNDLEEVVVTGYGVTKRKSFTGATTQKINNDALPAIGTEKYDAYVEENIQRFYDSSSTTHVRGIVLLSFELSKKGHPKNIFVVSSSCQACNATAIKILKDGSVWIGKKGQRQTKSFTF